MSSVYHDVDKNFLRSIYHEDLYVISENLPKSSETKPSVETKPQEKIISVLKVGIVAGSEKEIELYNEFLSKILQAVGLSWEDAGKVTQDSNSPAEFENYLVFGINNQSLVKFSSPVFLNQVLTQGASKFIFTYSLDEIEKSKDKKKALWAAMQDAFLKK